VQLLVPGINSMLPLPPQGPHLQQQQQKQQQDAFSAKSPRPAGGFMFCNRTQQHMKSQRTASL
jgi:hypothetical protein